MSYASQIANRASSRPGSGYVYSARVVLFSQPQSLTSKTQNFTTQASSKMLELIKGFVIRIAADRVTRSNGEILVLRNKDGTKSMVNSYPAASKTLRGSGGE